MKISIFMCFLLFSFYNIFGQTGGYPGLYSDDFEEIIDELEIIVQNNDQNAISILHELIVEQAPYIQLSYLRVLSLLEDDEIISYCNDFISRSDNFTTHEYRENPLEMKVEATKIMMENNDYSTVNFIFEYFDLYKPELNSLQRDVLTLFPLIASNVPSTLNQIENGLLYVFYNSTISENRFFALYTFEEIFGDSVLNIAIIGIIDDDQSIRNLSLSYLVEYKYHDLNNVLRDRLLEDPGRSMRTKIVKFLLGEFGAPSDLKFVIEYQPNEIHPTSKSLIGFYIQNFIPPRPTVPTSEMITNLIGYTDELYQYGWITEVSVYNQYLEKLRDIEKAYSNKEKELLCAKLTEFLNFTEGLHNSPLLTEEGYKFMHYHGTYIKENVEDEFGKCD